MPDNRVRIWFSLFVLVVFCVGLAAGILIGRRLQFAERPFVRGPQGAPEFRPGSVGEGRRGAMRGMLVERLGRDLDLTPEQRAKIAAILANSRTRLDTMQRDVRERFEEEGRSLRDEIRSVLTPEQQQTFDRQQNERRGPGRRGPPR
jgi:Spy/CpxP family protein refolding chaperone